MPLSHEQPAPSSPSSTSLRDRVHGRGPTRTHPEPPPPDLSRTLEAIRRDANDYFERLDRSPRGLRNWDLEGFLKSLRAECAKPAFAAWDASPLTIPPHNGEPLKRHASSNGAAS